MSAVAWTEFLCGPVEGEHIELAARVMEAPVGFTAADSVATARLFDLGGRRRGSLLDCMVAAVALGAGATLATTNAVDFRRFEPAGLAVLAP